MPSLKRIKTKFQGVYYINGKSVARSGKSERIYYIRFRKNGIEVEEKAGRQFMDAMTAAKAAKIRAECIEGKRLPRVETRIRSKIQKSIQKELENNVLACTSESPEESGLFQEYLIASEENFRAFFETASDLMCMANKDGNLTYVNESMVKTLGYSKEEMIGMHITQFLHEKHVEERFESNYKKLVKKGKLDLETTWVTKSGESIYGEEKLVAVYTSQGTFVGARGVLRDITQRKLAELALRKREVELDVKNKTLEEMNAALRVLLKRRDEDKTEIEEKVILNIQELVMPYLEKLKRSRLDPGQESFVGILESNLKDITSPFIRRLSTGFLKLTPTEIQVANHVKQGKTTKEIAELLNLSVETIEFHRKNIRNKIGIKNKKENLRTHLLAFNAG